LRCLELKISAPVTTAFPEKTLGLGPYTIFDEIVLAYNQFCLQFHIP